MREVEKRCVVVHWLQAVSILADLEAELLGARVLARTSARAHIFAVCALSGPSIVLLSASCDNLAGVR